MMVVRSVYKLKSFGTLDEAQKYVYKISNGAGRHSQSELEIHYDPKAKAKVSLGGGGGLPAVLQKAEKDAEEAEGNQWAVVVVNETMPPGARECAECEKPFFGTDDYLCPECRGELV